MTSAQTAWLLYDFANAAYALIVRTVFAPLCIKLCADGVVSSGDATSCWGMTASVSGIIAGALSVFLGRFCDIRRCRKKSILFLCHSRSALHLRICLLRKRRFLLRCKYGIYQHGVLSLRKQSL